MMLAIHERNRQRSGSWMSASLLLGMALLSSSCTEAPADTAQLESELFLDRPVCGLLANGDPQDWSMYNHDPCGTRSNIAEVLLNPFTVGNLKVRWSYPTDEAVSGTPIVVGNTIYAGSGNYGGGVGHMYSLTRDGQLRWKTQVAGGVTGSALLHRDIVIFGDQTGAIYGLDRGNGAVRWQARPNPHPLAAIYGSATPIGDYVAVGIASNEIPATADPNYPCCSFRGSVVLLNPKTGAVRWHTYVVSDAERAQGASGAPVWSTPTYDPDTQTIYITTGNNYSHPATGTSDAIIALDAQNGHVRWVSQRLANDVYNLRYPWSPANPDADFGDSPQIYRSHGRKVIGAGQKSGVYYVVDAATGAVQNGGLQIEPTGVVGGLFADSAVAYGNVYANGINWTQFPSPPMSGDLIAMSGDGTEELWRFPTANSPNMGGVAVAGGVVYFQSLIDGGLYALDARTGQKLARVGVGGGSSGPSVSRGRVYVGTGTFLGPSTPPGNIISLGL